MTLRHSPARLACWCIPIVNARRMIDTPFDACWDRQNRADEHRIARCWEWRPGGLRRPGGSAESCCLPALTRFTGTRRTGPGHHTQKRATHNTISSSVRARVTGREGCQSGRMGTLGKRVRREPPWVQIPHPPRTSPQQSRSEVPFSRYTERGHCRLRPQGSGSDYEPVCVCCPGGRRRCRLR